MHGYSNRNDQAMLLLLLLLLQGWQLALKSEVGGMAPGTANLRYVRNQAHASWAAALTEGLSVHVEAATGILGVGCGAFTHLFLNIKHQGSR